MTWTALLGLTCAIGMLLVASFARRQSLLRMRQSVRAREQAHEQGATAQLQHPVVDLSRCLGCGACVRACPEAGVLELVHGQAMVVRGARCVGHAACETACPVDAITVTLGDTSARDDIPALHGLEAVGSPGVFVAGELSARALIATAVQQGAAVAHEVAARKAARELAPLDDPDVLDLLIVGAGPAGLSCALACKELGLSFVVIEQEESVGGTVARYPRRKLVMTQPLQLPLVGTLEQTTWVKEDLVALWEWIVAEHALPIECGTSLVRARRRSKDELVVETSAGPRRARALCLAVGRRGTPRRLGVEGEELAKVAYSLLDAESYRGRRVLVVGGGDSAVEAALALAEQAGTEVTLSYRGAEFARIRGRNAERLEQAETAGRVRVLRQSHVVAITPRQVRLEVAAERDGEVARVRLANDDVFVMIGGEPPFALAQAAGVSFDPALRERSEATEERGSGLLPALLVSFLLVSATLLFALWHLDYYGLPLGERPTHDKHALLRPGQGLGLWFGVGATTLIVVNLLYLLRRGGRWIRFGTLRAWMTSHVATGVLALLFAALHAALAPRDTVGGQSFWALLVLLVTGAIGRYFYAYVPRAANGRELDLTEVKTELARLGAQFDRGQQQFHREVRAAVEAEIEARQWRGSFLSRVAGLVTGQWRLRALQRQLRRRGSELGLATDQVEPALVLAARAHRTALMAAHFEDLRSVLGSWRFLHRWIAALMVLLLVVHIVHALAYASIDFGGGP